MNTTDQIAAAKKLVELLEAQARGETIEYNYKAGWAEDADPIIDGFDVLRNPDDYRVKPKPSPYLPKGVFWVRNHTRKAKDDQAARLVLAVSNNAVTLSTLSSTPYCVDFPSLFSRYHWSRDRETWLTFENHETPVKEVQP